jgi:ubiquinone/menaquinone biosynthesis C-methylase UbiE
MARESSAAIGADEPPEPTRAERKEARLASRFLDVALGAIPLPLRVLDIGCRYGDLLAECGERVPNVIELVGVDADPVAIEEARRWAGDAARFHVASAADLPFPDEHFDLVVSLMSFSRWGSPRRGLAEVRRVLHPAGVFVVADAGTTGVPAALAAAGLRPVRREPLTRKLFGSGVQAFLSSR